MYDVFKIVDCIAFNDCVYIHCKKLFNPCVVISVTYDKLLIQLRQPYKGIV